MKLNLLLSAAMLAFGGLAAPSAQAVGRLADVTVIDRHSGATLPVHYHRGEYWVAGLPGGRYAVQVRNRTGERLMAVTSVDGVNVISGQTAGVEQTGYVFAPWQSYQITGWRKSDAQVAAFEFSDASDSYAQRTGRPGHVGVIGVALFREKRPEYVAPPMPMHTPMHTPAQPHERSSNDSRDTQERLGQREQTASADAATPPAAPAPAPSTKSSMGESSLASGAAQGARASQAPEAVASRRHAEQASPKLGTAHGQREASHVQNVAFERRSAQPEELLRIRYDSRDNLIAMGVIAPRPLPATTPNPFPQSPLVGFVPDPPALRE